MIWITGDTHADFRRFANRRFAAAADDYLIICGDFGGVWDGSAAENYWLDWLGEKPWTTLFLDGNHENHERLASFPTEQWHGGKVHVIRPRLLHLMRGQVFVIDGLRFFVMGGAASHDVDAGVLDPEDPDIEAKRRRLDRARIFYRVNRVSWWKEELPSEAEYAEGRTNLERVGDRVDVVLSHCAPSSVQELIGGGGYRRDSLTDYLDEIRQRCAFRRWFFGHYHGNLELDQQYVLLYRSVVPLSDYLPGVYALEEG